MEAERKKGPRPISEPVEGLTKVTENGLLGWVNSKGELAFPLRRYDEAEYKAEHPKGDRPEAR